jgi:hypothetical protein
MLVQSQWTTRSTRTVRPEDWLFRAVQHLLKGASW